jgi:hypothetical protein
VGPWPTGQQCCVSCYVSLRNVVSPVVSHLEILQLNRSFWSFISKENIQRSFFNTPKTFVEPDRNYVRLDDRDKHHSSSHAHHRRVGYRLAHYDFTRDPYQDGRHLVTFSFVPFSPHEYVSFTSWHTDTSPWVGTEDMITYEVPGMVFFTKTGEYDSSTV